MYLAGGAVLHVQRRRASKIPCVQRQLSMAAQRRGDRDSAPFTLFYSDPVYRGRLARLTHAMNLAVLSLPFIPLTWAYAILRYRLMDVDIIFQEGYVYTLATLCAW